MKIKQLIHRTIHLMSPRSDAGNEAKSQTFIPYKFTRVALAFICLLLTSSMASICAQGILDTNIQIRKNDPTVTVTVTVANKSGNANPQVGEEVTVTLANLPETKKAIVKACESFGGTEFKSWDTQTNGKSFTFKMPAYKLFIDINVQYIKTPDTYALTVKTEGLSSAKVAVTVTATNMTGANSPYQVKPGTEVTASLPTSLPSHVSLLGIEGSATDGSWFLNPVIPEGGSCPDRVTFDMPETDVILRFMFKEDTPPGPGPTPAPDPAPEPDPDPVYYKVTIPSVEGAATDPAAGSHRIETGEDFSFFLTLDKDYDRSTPVVTTDRGDELTPRTSDGAYVVRTVRQNIAIRIDGIRRNTAVSNEKIETPAAGFSLSSSGSTLHIYNDLPGVARIYTFGGSLVRTVDVAAGMQSVQLPRGVYIVRMGEESLKIVL